MKTLAAVACLLSLGSAVVAADPVESSPRSLRMRPRARYHPRWLPLTVPGKRVAQVPDQPAPADPGTTEDQPPIADPAATPDAPPPATAVTVAPAAPAVGLSDEELAKLAEQEAQTEVITVTGSLIGRKEIDQPSPISVLDRAKLEAAGVTNVGDVLQKSSAQGNALNAQNNYGGDGSTRINLRSIGANRTLVLINGRRVVASGLGADSSVDLSTIPLAAIERVEILKDGASAIYGSDAIAGVVNIITRSDFEGTEGTVYTGTSSRGDGTNYDLSLVTGHSSPKGNITFALGYQQQKPVLAGARGFSKQVSSYDFTCTDEKANLPPDDPDHCTKTVLSGSQASVTGRLNTANGGNQLSVPGCTAKICTADGMGGFRNFQLPTDTDIGDNYNFQTLNYLFTPSQRVNLFATGHYDVSKHVRTFFEAMYNRRSSEQQLAEAPISLSRLGAPISAASIYNPFGVDVIDYSRRLTEFGTRNFTQNISTSRMVVGVEGNVDEDVPLFANWKWEGSFDYGRNDGTDATKGDLIKSHLRNALGPSFLDPVLGPRCGTRDAPLTDGCVPLDLLNVGKVDARHPTGNVDPRAIKYLTFTGISQGFNEQRTTLLQAHGKLADLPNHGDVSVAIGGDYRHEKGGNSPDPLTSTGDTTGSAVQPTEGAYHAFEGFGEISIVPVSQLEALEWVELDAAARAYNYNTFGSGVTGKISGLVRTAGGVAVRGTYGTAFRAPNIAELFNGQSDNSSLLTDPCDTRPPNSSGTKVLDAKTAAECAKEGVPANAEFGTSEQRSLNGGNAGLKPETAKIGTAGIVWEPLKGLDFTVDYWRIQIDSAITSLPVATIVSQCYQGGNDLFCSQIQRGSATHAITRIIDLTQNVGSLATSGLDFSAAYEHKSAAGTFRHAFEGTYLFKYNIDTGTVDPNTGKEQILHGRNVYDLGVNPYVKLNLFTTWQHPSSGFGAGFNMRYVSGFRECDNNNCNDPTNGSRDVDSYLSGDLFVDYTVKSTQGTTRATLGVNNINDAMPPVIYNGSALTADESAYDFLGRFFYVRLSQLF